MAVIVEIGRIKHVFGWRMGLRIGDEVTDISHEGIVLGVSIHADYIVKALDLNTPETQEGYMLASIPSLLIAEEWFLSMCRVILSVVLPVQQISDRPVLAIIVEVPLGVTKNPSFMCTEITARDHG